MKFLIALSAIVFVFQGCATMSDQQQADLEKELTAQPVEEVIKTPAESGDQAKKDSQSDANEEVAEPMTRYSDLNNMAPPSDRQYKRMTRQRMEEESELNASAGSLWKMEGQTSFLFAENKHRRAGDPTTIKMEGSALKMLENKAWVINDLLGQLEEQKKIAEEESKKAEERKQRLAQLEAERKLRSERIAKGEIVVDPLDEQQMELDAKAEEIAAATAARGPASVARKDKKDDKIDLKEVEVIPAKIVEKMQDDTYRIRGQQYLTIKKKPYKVIATALIRAEDFNDAEISSNKLLEAQYDLVHVKRTANE